MRPLIWLIWLSFTGFSQVNKALFPNFKTKSSTRIPIESVISQIREMKVADPANYGEALDFYYLKIASSGKSNWIEKLEEFSLDPECPAKLKHKINDHIQAIRTLQIGELAPDFVINKFQFSQYQPLAKQVLILFYSPSCFHCTELLIDLIPYTTSKKLPVIALQIDNDTNPWIFPDEWIKAKSNDKIRLSYGVFSTPTLFLIQVKNRKISGMPESIEQLKSMEPLF